MAIKLINERQSVQYAGDKRICELICDNVADVTNLQTEYPNCCCGSTALVIQTGDVYIVNTSGVWTLLGG